MSDENTSVTVAVRLSLLEEKVDRLLVAYADTDTRQRNMEQQLAKTSALVGFVSAGISAVVTGAVTMFRAR